MLEGDLWIQDRLAWLPGWQLGECQTLITGASGVQPGLAGS